METLNPTVQTKVSLTPNQVKITRDLISRYFKKSKDQPFIATPGQCEIFYKIISRDFTWLWLSAPTRYGKSEILAMGLIFLAVFDNLKIPIVAGSIEKANKIMEYIVIHIGDHPELYHGLLLGDISDIEKLKVKMSKEALRWVSGGWLFVTSVDSRNVSKEGEGVVGEGGDVVVLEEAGLIKSKEQFSKIVRMPEESRGWGKFIMSGNCVEGSVFEDAFNNPLYHKVRVDLDQAIEEGRYSREHVENIKTQTTGKDWKRYWLVIFPDRNETAYFKPRVYDVLPHEIENGQVVELKHYGAIDPSLGEVGKSQGEKTNSGSKIGIIVLGKDKKGILYEEESIIEHLEPNVAMNKIFNLPYKFTKFVFEAIQFQKYFLQMTRELARKLGLQIPFEGITQSRNKTERIESLEPYINNGDILFKGDNQLYKDLVDYPNCEFLDGLDALEMAFRASGVKRVSVIIGDETY